MNLFIAGTDFVCSMLLIVILASVVMLNKSEKKYVFYIISIVALCLAAAADCTAYIMDECGGNYYVHFYSNLLSYIGIDVVLPGFVYYLSERLRETVLFSKIHERIVLALCSIDLLVIIWGAYSGKLFVIENNTIVYGPMANFIGIIQILVSIYYLIQVFRIRKSLNKSFTYTICLYFFVPIAGTIVVLINSAYEFTYMISTVIFVIVYIVIVREDLQTASLKEKIMYQTSVTDNLTGLLNRRAYSTEVEGYTDTYSGDFLYMSLDVNGLKIVNDNIGHEAGDEIIKGAARCMQRALGAFGKLYRTGGDEFIAILNVPEAEVEKIIGNFGNEMSGWRGILVDSLSVSFGYVRGEEAQGMPINEVAALAEHKMYEDKEAYYKKMGVDRRGQHEAHTALCNLYTKILRIDLTQNKYQIVNMDENEQTEEMGFADSFSKWMIGFGKSGQVYEEDLEGYMKETDIGYLRDYFKQGKKSISIFYRRKIGDEYRKVVMEMIPTSAYSDDNQEVFLYVKSIDR